MLRRSILQGFFSFALFPHKFLRRKPTRYKSFAFYMNGKRLVPVCEEKVFAEGHVSPSPADYTNIILGRIGEPTKFVKFTIREV